MTDAQLADRPKNAGILHFPTVLGAVVPAYNIPGVNAALNFTPEALAGIYLGKITKWNDPAITGPNPGVNLPERDIIVVHRSDGSGTTYIWTDYLSKVSDEWKTKVGKNTSVNWPVGLGGKGNEGVAGLVKQQPGSDRIRRADLCHPERHDLRQGEERRRGLCEGRLGQRYGSGSRNRKVHARRFPGFHHQRCGKDRLPHRQLHLAVGSGTRFKDPAKEEGDCRFPPLDVEGWTEPWWNRSTTRSSPKTLSPRKAKPSHRFKLIGRQLHHYSMTARASPGARGSLSSDCGTGMRSPI